MKRIDPPQLTGQALATALHNARAPLLRALAEPLPLALLLACVARLAHKLRQHQLAVPLSPQQRMQLLAYCEPDLLQQKLDRELGEDPFCLRRINYREPRFEAWRALGCVLHVMPSNAPLLPFLATLESLLVGNVNWVRPSGEDHLSAQLLEAFVACDDSGRLADHVLVWHVAREDIAQLLPHVDAVSAWGGDTALRSLRQALRPGCRWIPWGHKISFCYLTPAALAASDRRAALFDRLADEVCRHDQQACSSPQLLLVDSDEPAVLEKAGQYLADAMERRSAHWPVLSLDLHQGADVGGAISLAELQQAFQDQPGRIWRGSQWSVIWQHRIAMEASPLFRTVLLRPMPRAQLPQALLGWRGYLQTCGLACTGAELCGLSAALVHAGVGRITTPGAMHDGYIGEPHDNVRALTQLARRISVSADTAMVSGRATLDEGLAQVVPHAAPEVPEPVMDKAAFERAGIGDKARLFFRSGGSTGIPTLSAFSYRDYHRQMRGAADGLYAAGLDPVTDRVLNLLGAGNLYGGLLSSFLILDKMDVVHFPMGMSGQENYEDIAELIQHQGINTLIGMPSSIYQLFWRSERSLRVYGGVRKIFLGGEHVSPAQRQFLASFDVALIRSAIYGSNDAGPLGHACAHCEDGSFHLLASLQQLEIVSEHDDTPVAAGQVGRLLFTSLERQAQHVARYEIGDLGHAIDGVCPCGLATPRFRLLGRHGHYARLGTRLLDMTQLLGHLDMPVQFVIEVRQGVDCLHAYVDGDVVTATGRLADSKALSDEREEGHCTVDVSYRQQTDFERLVHSGKPALVLDRRVQK